MEIVAGMVFNFQFAQNAFTDAESDAITYSYDVSPAASWLSYDTATRTFDGTPSVNVDANEYTVTIKASDSVATGSDDFKLTVLNN